MSENTLIIAQLSEKICKAEDDIEKADLTLLSNSKQELEELMSQKASACMFRSKVRFTELGEKPTSYYFNLEKLRYNARTCNALYDYNGNLITSTERILKLQEMFYRNLYSRNEDVQCHVINTYGVVVPEDYRTKTVFPFTLEELGAATKLLPHGKTCENDGIPIEFYKVFWNRLKSDFHLLSRDVYGSMSLEIGDIVQTGKYIMFFLSF